MFNLAQIRDKNASKFNECELWKKAEDVVTLKYSETKVKKQNRAVLVRASFTMSKLEWSRMKLAAILHSMNETQYVNRALHVEFEWEIICKMWKSGGMPHNGLVHRFRFYGDVTQQFCNRNSKYPFFYFKLFQ